MILIHPLTAANPVWLTLLEHRTGLQAVACGHTARLIHRPRILQFPAAKKGGAQ
jgi:hypothetical protein